MAVPQQDRGSRNGGRARSQRTIGDWLDELVSERGAAPAARQEPIMERAPAAPARPAPAAQARPQSPVVAPAPAAQAPAAQEVGLEERLSRLSQSLSTLERRAGMAHDEEPAPVARAPQPQMDAPVSAPARSGPVLADAIRRRKMSLDEEIAASAPAMPASAPAMPANAPAAAAPAPQIANKTSDLIDEVARLSRMIDDIRGTATRSVEIGQSVAGELPRLGEKIETLAAAVPAPGTLQRIEGDVALLRQAIAKMPTADAINELEKGYTSILERLEMLKVNGVADTKIDQLYNDVGGLRDAIDRIESAGQESTRAALAEMKALTERIERNQASSDPQALARALEEVTQLARKGSSEASADAMAAVVERLVSIESRIVELNREAAKPDALVATLADIKERIGQLSHAGQGAQELDRRLGEINARFDRLDQSVNGQANMPAVLADLSRRIDGISSIGEAQTGVQARLDDLNRRMEDVAAAAASSPEVATQVAALARRVDTLAASLPMRDIERGLLELSERVNGLATEAGSRELASVVQSLAERVERLVQHSDGRSAEDRRQIETLEQRLCEEIRGLGDKVADLAREQVNEPAIRGLHVKMDSIAGRLGEHTLSTQALEMLEGRIGALLQRQSSGQIAPEEIVGLRREIEGLRQNGISQFGTQAMEGVLRQEITRLAHEIETARQTRDVKAIGDIESQMQQIVSRLDQIGDVNSEPTKAVLTEFNAIRDQQSAVDTRMLDLLAGMQSTMQTVVQRLHVLEEDDAAASAVRSSISAMLDQDAADLPASAIPVSAVAEVEDLPDLPDLDLGEIARLADEPISLAPMAAEAAPASAVLAPSPAPKAVPGDEMPVAHKSFEQQATEAAKATETAATERVRVRKAGSDALARASSKSAREVNKDLNQQKASFIAAARRAAQQAAAEAANAQSRGHKPEIRVAEQPPLPKVEKGKADKADPKKADARKADAKKGDARQGAKSSRLRPALLAASVLAIAAGTYAIFVPLTPPEESTLASAPVTEQAPVAPAVTGEAPAVETPAVTALAADADTDADTQANATPPEGERTVRVVGSDITQEGVTPPAAGVSDPLASTAPVEDAANDARFTPVAPEAETASEPATPASASDLATSIGTPRELPEAIGPLRLRVAAVSGDAVAAFEIATRYTEGRFVPQDLAEAAIWYARSAEAGLAPAAYRLGSLYERGNGVPRDKALAADWYTIAANAGNPKAMHNLAVLSAEGINGTPDFAAAAHWFEMAAERGLADSQFNLGVLYAKGLGVEQDLVESFKWFALAALQGDNDAGAKRDEIAAALGEETHALAQARVDRWTAEPIVRASVEVEAPAGGWEDGPVRSAAVDTPDMIRRAQELLATRGYAPGPADGVAGPQTADAIRAFQRSAGLAETGSVDATLLEALGRAN